MGEHMLSETSILGARAAALATLAMVGPKILEVLKKKIIPNAN